MLPASRLASCRNQPKWLEAKREAGLRSTAWVVTPSNSPLWITVVGGRNAACLSAYRRNHHVLFIVSTTRFLPKSVFCVVVPSNSPLWITVAGGRNAPCLSALFLS